MKIEILDRAKQDFLDGFRFYENQSEGVGRYFLDSVMADIESLSLYAGVHAKQFGYHRMLARRFPFAVYYRMESNAIRVYAVLDCRRNPTWIEKRLTNK
ncbi:MAG TPA: type II toxin-antitoxin system RelE/ParE family toxin [Thermoguttaceae bacterium]|nr:type II toxin-antitoxin system RelE/ParE family toxin [Thermoguttaceae bacterium]